MTQSNEKRVLFENVVRLRRIGRLLPGDRDVTAVRLTLERELGETVSQRFAASVLGVTHTALARRVKAGDLPLVLSPAGRMQVPVPVLLDLVESVRADHGGRHVLTPTMDRRREAARTMRFDVDDTAGPPRDAHARAQARSLAYHRVVAQRLRRPMVNDARHVLLRWQEEQRIDPRYVARWEAIFSGSLADVRRQLVEQSSVANDLRQNSPFAGVLSEPERQRILQEVR